VAPDRTALVLIESCAPPSRARAFKNDEGMPAVFASIAGGSALKFGTGTEEAR
jgi:hypothetical protein